MYSNTTADMLYIKERIEEMCSKTGENVVVRGYAANVCRTERGVKYLGRRLAEWIVKTAVPELGHVSKISFIAHSLGGLVQSFAIAYIQHNYPKFFETIQPENFITMASPLLGISNDNPAYVKFFLSFGIVGKTGQDLGLQGSKPLLLLLPSRSTRKVLQKFKRRTVYANVLNDGIVPLRTGALMFLDWNGLCEVYDALKSSGSLNPSFNDLKETSSAENQVGEIPANMEQQEEGEAQDASEGVIPDAAGIEVEAESNDDSSDGGLLGSIKTTLQSWMSSFQSPTTTIKVRKIRRYQRYQTMTAGDEDQVDDNWDADDDNDVSKFESVTPIPKTNVISGIGRVLLPPAPTSEFLLDPSTRQNFILHDRIYRPSMIPRQKLKKSDSFIKGLDIIGRRKHMQERIARKWHRGMSWRKVLVNLPPDAHNNIMVRRNFANAYGWPVVDHLVENHFGLKSFKGEDLEDFALRPEDEVADSEDFDNDIKQLEDKMSKLLDVEHDKSVKEREKVEHQGKIAKHGPRNDSPELAPPPPIGNVAEDLEIPKRALSRDSEDEDDSWINDSSSLCYDGPAGMLNTIPEKVNDQVEAFKRTIFPEEEDEAPAIGPVKPDSKADGEDVRDIYVNDPTQMMNTYP
ncbi:DEKNAAC102279 [Brettanomyces naardenensis]|uniref:DEKNAAC102279 n=1 Tax=Brettanomyces naardenensis TaxID=13370 RepID=A0A448YKI0_BRENA|nr:DEKNAAC102279 [Brettanomyces naardenensis]